MPLPLDDASSHLNRGEGGARSYYRFVLPLIHFIPFVFKKIRCIYNYLKRQCDRALGEGPNGKWFYLNGSHPRKGGLASRGRVCH